MPFRHKNTLIFGPDVLAALTAAFDVAWQQVFADRLIENENQIEEFKRVLAKCIREARRKRTGRIWRRPLR